MKRALLKESSDLLFRMERLESFTKTDTYRQLPDLDRELLRDQAFAMRSYYKALSARIQRAS